MNKVGRMAEAMIEDSYKSSHNDLTEWEKNSSNVQHQQQQQQQQQQQEQQKQHEKITPETTFNQVSDSNNQGGNGKEHHLEVAATCKKASEERSVVIQVPAKRARLCTAYSPNEVVQALTNSISREERFDAINKALSSFDHDVQSIHDAEIEAGVDIALMKYLVFLEFKTGFRRKPIQEDLVAITHEISLACNAFEMVYRASSEMVATSFRRVGTDLLHILVTLIDEEIKTRCQTVSPDSSPEVGGRLQTKLQDKITTKSHSTSENSSKTTDHKEATTASVTSTTSKSKSRLQKVGEEVGERNDPGSRSVTPPPLLLPDAATKNKFSNGDSSIVNNVVVGSYHRDLLLRKATKILGHFARVGEATKPIAHFPGLLGSILNLINLRPYDAIPWESRLSCLWTIANLACNTDNMQMMMCTPGLVNSLVNVGCRPLVAAAASPILQHSSSPHYNGENGSKTSTADSGLEKTMDVLRSRSIASRALLNLSWPPENKIPMAENMALVQVLCQLALVRDIPNQLTRRSRTVDDIALQTRRHAVGAIRNLAAAPRRSKIFLCRYNNGKLLDILTETALNDPDQRVKDLSFAAIHNLANHDTAEMMIVRPALVLALKNVLLAEEDNNNQQQQSQQEQSHRSPELLSTKPDSPRSHASSTLLVLERSITPEMNSYENLRDLLEAVNPSPSSDSDEPDGLQAVAV